MTTPWPLFHNWGYRPPVGGWRWDPVKERNLLFWAEDCIRRIAYAEAGEDLHKAVPHLEKQIRETTTRFALRRALMSPVIRFLAQSLLPAPPTREECSTTAPISLVRP